MTSIIKTICVGAAGKQSIPQASYAKRIKGVLAVSVLPLAITGCEAPLNLEGVDKELAKSVRRTDQFQAVAANDSVVVAVGAAGLVLSSPLSEVQWARQTLAGAPSFVDVANCPDQSFAALSTDGQVWFSSDNGASWQAKATGTQESLLSLTCAPDNSVWVTGSYSTLLSSADQGESWNETTLEQDAQLTSIQFIDEQQAVVAGEFGMVSRSEDGGQSWSEPEFMPNDFYPQGIYFSSTETGWAAGLSGQILHTADGGLSWSRQETPTESPLYSFHALGERLFVTGDHGNVLVLNGERWERVPSPKIPVYLRDAQALNDKQLLVAGGWGALFTVDVQ